MHTLCASHVDKCPSLIGQSIAERAPRHNTHTNTGQKRELYDIGHLQPLFTPPPEEKQDEKKEYKNKWKAFLAIEPIKNSSVAQRQAFLDRKKGLSVFKYASYHSCYCVSAIRFVTNKPRCPRLA